MLDTDKTTTLERLSHALSSTNLKLREGHCDLDYVIAFGMVASKQEMASALLTIHFGGRATGYKEAKRAAITLTQKLDMKRGWDLPLREIVRVADSALKMYLIPNCPKCTGVMFEVIPDTPKLSNRACPQCHGSGRRSYPRRNSRAISEVVNVLLGIEGVAELAIRRKMDYYR